MIDSQTRAAIGSNNRRKGAKSERDLARFLREQGWPDAERKADNGWKTHDRESADHGDIRGTPRLVWQLKYVTGMSDREIADAMHDAETQATAAGADYGIMVQRRTGKADPAEWWAWLPATDIHALMSRGTNESVPPLHNVPVRVTVRGIAHLLRYAGYAPSTQDTE